MFSLKPLLQFLRINFNPETDASRLTCVAVLSATQKNDMSYDDVEWWFVRVNKLQTDIYLDDVLVLTFNDERIHAIAVDTDTKILTIEVHSKWGIHVEAWSLNNLYNLDERWFFAEKDTGNYTNYRRFGQHVAVEVNLEEEKQIKSSLKPATKAVDYTMRSLQSLQHLDREMEYTHGEGGMLDGASSNFHKLVLFLNVYVFVFVAKGDIDGFYINGEKAFDAFQKNRVVYKYVPVYSETIGVHMKGACRIALYSTYSYLSSSTSWKCTNAPQEVDFFQPFNENLTRSLPRAKMFGYATDYDNIPQDAQYIGMDANECWCRLALHAVLIPAFDGLTAYVDGYTVDARKGEDYYTIDVKKEEKCLAVEVKSMQSIPVWSMDPTFRADKRWRCECANSPPDRWKDADTDPLTMTRAFLGLWAEHAEFPRVPNTVSVSVGCPLEDEGVRLYCRIDKRRRPIPKLGEEDREYIAISAVNGHLNGLTVNSELISGPTELAISHVTHFNFTAKSLTSFVAVSLSLINQNDSAALLMAGTKHTNKQTNKRITAWTGTQWRCSSDNIPKFEGISSFAIFISSLKLVENAGGKSGAGLMACRCEGMDVDKSSELKPNYDRNYELVAITASLTIEEVLVDGVAKELRNRNKWDIADYIVVSKKAKVMAVHIKGRKVYPMLMVQSSNKRLSSLYHFFEPS
ncbi:hypothetical protein HELRODRAFT_172706 [Helobdella robusta]|uniref:Uncharacterized protein n=1 Tax=Helobdella robusta TaxID=6412 RepID=T1F5T9_HELRO|nr:hypothetical protein HELRODRAFT_172706 [Helobdella robusta]ESO04343.1 hypothetical protein HELRODRAFT_172706 [Helobdella robusta]